MFCDGGGGGRKRPVQVISYCRVENIYLADIKLLRNYRQSQVTTKVMHSYT